MGHLANGPEARLGLGQITAVGGVVSVDDDLGVVKVTKGRLARILARRLSLIVDNERSPAQNQIRAGPI
jgi:hypothetical protein